VFQEREGISRESATDGRWGPPIYLLKKGRGKESSALSAKRKSIGRQWRFEKYTSHTIKRKKEEERKPNGLTQEESFKPTRAKKKKIYFHSTTVGGKRERKEAARKNLSKGWGDRCSDQEMAFHLSDGRGKGFAGEFPDRLEKG